MPYNYNLSEEAENDILDAYIWYEQQRAGLGEEFLECMEGAQRLILQNPAAYSVRYKTVRAFLINRFPYLILYILKKKDIVVISVFNTNQNPQTWKARVKN